MSRSAAKRLATALLLGALFAPVASAAAPELVKDINPGHGRGLPGQLTAVGKHLYFLANDGRHGRELWVTDGTRAGTRLVRDIWPGREASYAGSITPFRAGVLFAASDGIHGLELWRSDGTQRGTRLVADVNPGRIGGGPLELTVLGRIAFFTAFDPEHGNEVWRTDGTAAGTWLLADVAPGPAQSGAQSLEVARGRLYFYADADGDQRHLTLWQSDGTPGGTRPADAIGGIPGADLVFAGDWILGEHDGDDGSALSVSDGGRARPLRHFPLGEAPEDFTAAGKRLYFVADDGGHGGEPWVTDGTRAGTRLLKDLTPGMSGSVPVFFGAVGERLFLVAYQAGLNSPWLWRSDGTTATTVPLTGAIVDPIDLPAQPLAHGRKLFFAGRDPRHGDELWVSDGTRAGTRRLADVRPGRASSHPWTLAAVGSTLYFPVSDGIHGRELWKLETRTFR